MRWSFQIGTVFGIPIRLHITFILLLVVLAFAPVRSDGHLPMGLSGVVLVCTIFACVVLHELGHSLVAMRFGMVVDSITLLPIGGLAAMRTVPRTAGAEFLIASAGPAVSFALAGCFATMTYLIHGPAAIDLVRTWHADAGLLVRLMWINVLLGGFNLLPAFPLDGGRIVRAALWWAMGFSRATRVAGVIGQVLAIGLLVLAITQGSVWLMVIALFIYTGAQAETRSAAYRALLERVPAAQAMVTNVEFIGPDEPIERVSERMAHGGQANLPVFDKGRLVGMITQDVVSRALTDGGTGRPAEQVMDRQIVFCRPDDHLKDVLEVMQQHCLPCVAVIQDNRFLGLIAPPQTGTMKRST